jgi:hypothetical protein
MIDSAGNGRVERPPSLLFVNDVTRSSDWRHDLVRFYWIFDHPKNEKPVSKRLFAPPITK